MPLISCIAPCAQRVEPEGVLLLIVAYPKECALSPSWDGWYPLCLSRENCEICRVMREYLDAAAEIGRNPVSKHQIQPEYGE